MVVRLVEFFPTPLCYRFGSEFLGVYRLRFFSLFVTRLESFHLSSAKEAFLATSGGGLGYLGGGRGSPAD